MPSTSFSQIRLSCAAALAALCWVTFSARAQFPVTAPTDPAQSDTPGQLQNPSESPNGTPSFDPFRTRGQPDPDTGLDSGLGFGPGSVNQDSTPGPNGLHDPLAQANAYALNQQRAMAASLASISLPADHLIAILQARPEVIVELKPLVAQRLGQPDNPVEADDISDEFLYQQLAVSNPLRVTVTNYLRARGYLSDRDLQAAAQQPRQADMDRDSYLGGDLSAVDRNLPQGSEATANPNNPLGDGLLTDPRLAGAVPGTLPPAAQMRSQTGRAQEPYLLPRMTPQTQREEPVNASTDEPKVLHQPAPYNLRSLRDLYTQIPESNAPLKRFGSEVFLNRTATGTPSGFPLAENRDAPLDVPLGPDYVVGAGDVLTINLWGGLTQSLSRTVDRDGRILLPEAGSLELAGLTLARAQSAIGAALRQQFRSAEVSVSIARPRSVRIYVVGDVQRPGSYDISAAATPVSALYAAGGPTAPGSLRTLVHLRGQQVVEKVDLYDFLLHGLRSGSERFQSGDTLLVPSVGPQVALSGAVKRPAIYELKAGESTLNVVVADAGGLTAAAAVDHISVERIGADGHRETVTLPNTAGPSPNLAAAVSPNIAPTHPEQAALAAFPLADGDRIRIAPILPYSERVLYLDGHVPRPGRVPYRDGMRLSDVLHSYRDLLPEPSAHGQIIRLLPPDLHPETIDFNVPDVLIGNANLDLQPFDTIRILGRYEVDAPRVAIHGEVLRPGTFPLSQDMTVARLVRMAGGFKRDALLESADLTSYTVENGSRVAGRLATVHIGAAVNGDDHSADVTLKAGDVLTVHQITGWNDIGQSATVNGQVRFPGSYGFREGERLSSVLRRAGGFRETAYPEGAVLVREQVRQLEEKSREELIRQIETSSSAARLAPNLGGGDTGATLQLIKAQQDEVLRRLKTQPPSGRLVVHLSADIASWANTPIDIELRRSDVLTVPKTPGFVLVTGQVYNATALTYSPGQSASWYLRSAGGTSDTANRKEIFIIRANGSILGRHSGSGEVLNTRLDPGDVIVVPQKIIGGSLFLRNLLTIAQLASSLAVTSAVTGL